MPLTCDPLTFDPAAVAHVFADGGVIRKNPSEIGGTWAFALVNAIGGRVAAASGHVAAAEVAPLPWVSNNLTECVALLLAFEQLPDGWAGPAYSDSLNAIKAHTRAGLGGCDLDPPEYLPGDLWRRMARCRNRLGAVTFTLLGGHPTRAELAAGVRKDGKPVSAHNVFCDREATAAGAAYLRSLDRQEATA